jgi:hypothetical protein
MFRARNPTAGDRVRPSQFGDNDDAAARSQRRNKGNGADRLLQAIDCRAMAKSAAKKAAVSRTEVYCSLHW